MTDQDLPAARRAEQAPYTTGRFSLAGMRILVTGAAGGIGSATARVMRELGAELVLLDRSHSASLAEEVNGTAHLCDITDRAQVERVCAEIGEVDACVLNAGVAKFDDWMAEDWNDSFHEIMGINVLGSLNVARAVLPRMLERRSGSVVICGSIAAYTGGGVFPTPPHYVTSKGALHTLMRWMAQRGGAHVRVNAVAPGVIATPLTDGLDYKAPPHQPIPRMGTADEVAWPIAFLCSPAASYITGSVIDINGGGYMRP